MSGIFYGVGVGPGDPELLTLKAVKTINQADVIIAPRTEKRGDSSALAIARDFIQAEAKILQLVFPMVYQSDALSQAWENNKNSILDFLQQGKKVVFLTLGDPMLYSTYIYMHRLLKDCGYPIFTIPGVTSFCAIASRLNYPLAEGNDILCVAPATADEGDLEQMLEIADKLVLMKVYKNYPKLLDQLEQHGFLSDAVMVSNYGLAGEKITPNLAETKEAQVNYLTTILAKKRTKQLRHESE
ncbi:precorrin-2 C(20)-methyltransferase [Desulforamulus aeronauticus]|uniref:Precorrin-2/cobalt-factor-2 C20-methyltransferase n=1 Tax=Desulforamulus aeronauticus DSM 10349 TaxID=1121421 RepID=A0A1M6UI93_9FIRM|nr:precorrin-2 C(20)-methyltransferase [Desulforamulus aeronauticus]SHK68863.1 precorrin-2/cobalt-factor-2 C20-methyltransferase [Desulforamulus aeronauticus DSM 10349]